MTRLHVVQTVASLSEAAGGPTRTIGALCEALARGGATVDIVAGSGDLLPDPALVTTRFAHPSGIGAALGAARAAYPDHAPILHDNGLWGRANIAASRAALAANLPYVVSAHGMLAPWALAHRSLKKRVAWGAYERRRLAGAHGLLATAEAERADIRRAVSRVPIATIPGGVDVPGVLPARPAGPPTLLFMSRIHPVKNLIALLDAWAVLSAQPRFGAWRLRIVGPDEGGHLATVRAHAERLGVSRVDFAGPVADADKSSAYAAADLFVLPSLTENFGVVVAEALAHGLPVVTTHGAPWAGVRDHGCGWWVAPDAAALADALGDAMARAPQDRAAMGARGRAWVARDFGWDGIAARTAAFYTWLLHGGQRPDFVDV